MGRIMKIGFFLMLFVASAGISAYIVLTLIVKSEDTVIVPDITGKELVYSLELLTDMGLNTKVRGSEYSRDIPKNHIIFQDPEPGAVIKKDRDVRIIISKGPKTVTMPNLEGLSIQQARIVLEENGLCQGKSAVAYSDTHQKDVVIAQSPTPGSIVVRDSCVNLLVSSGSRPQAYRMPDLSGISLEAAIQVLESLDLTLGEIRSEYHDRFPQNVVISQEPAAGYQVVEDSAVHLVLNREPGERVHDVLHTTGGVHLFRYRIGIGFMRKRIQIHMICFGYTIDLIDQLVRPGQTVWSLVPRNRNATLFLYQDNELIQTRVFDTDEQPEQNLYFHYR